MSRNDITGDKLISKVSNENFNKGYDQIDWSKKGKTCDPNGCFCTGACKKNSSDGLGHQCCNTGKSHSLLKDASLPLSKVLK